MNGKLKALWIVLSVAMLLGGCASTIPLDRQIEGLKHNSVLNDVSYDLKREATPFCEHPVYDIGIYWGKAEWFPSSFRTAWGQAFHVDNEIRGYQVLTGSPAMKEGVPVGTRLVQFGALQINQESTQKDIDEELQRIGKAGGAIPLTLQTDAGETLKFAIKPDLVCNVKFEVVYLDVPGLIAKDHYAVVTAGMHRYLSAPEDYVALASHGVGAVIAGDPKAKLLSPAVAAGSGLAAVFLGPAAVFAPLVFSMGSNESANISADRLGLVLVAKANHPLPTVAAYDKLFGAFAKEGRLTGFVWNQPMTEKRRESLEKTIMTITSTDGKEALNKLFASLEHELQ